MSNPIIKVENLGKKYIISHERQTGAARYVALRDVIAEKTRSLGQKILSPFTQNPGSKPRTPSKEEFWALRDVSLEIKQGERIGIIGRNGAGKTTLLKLLSRITEPSTGKIHLKGRVASLLEVGTGFHPELTGRENIYLNGAILGMGRDEIKKNFDEIVAFAEVEKFLDTPVKRYSSGMYVRLAFAVAAHLEPEILLVDEVLAVGDVEFQKKCLGKMECMGREGRTVVFISHNMPSIVNICQRVILLNEGEVIKDGRVAEVVPQYLTMARSTGGEVVWPDPEQAPGNDLVRLHKVCVLQDGVGGPTADIDISKDVTIQISYWNRCEGVSLYAALILKDQMGTSVLASNNHRSVSLTVDPWNGRPHPKGLFQSSCSIPGNFLNNGRYSVSVFVGKGISDTQAFMEDAVSMYVHDTGEIGKEYFGSWAGMMIRPRLAW
ncbi:unnamed protein product, partial [marine sediment metagenome]